MKYVSTIKNITLSPKEEKIINRYLHIIKRKLTNFTDDIPTLSVFIKSHEKNHFLSGLITLTLPRKKLIAKTSGHKLAEVIHIGFERLNKEFEKYKALHFKGSSKYPNHQSINQNDT